MDKSDNGENIITDGPQGEPWWKPGLQILSEVSTWIVVPIVLALVVGKSLDAHYGTKPVIFLISAGIGFIFTCIGMVRVIKNYMKNLKEVEKEKDK